MSVRIKIVWENPHKGMWTSHYKNYRLYIVNCYISQTFQWTIKTPEHKEIDGVSENLDKAKEKIREIIEME